MASEKKRRQLVPDAPVGIVAAFGGRLELPRYLQLDDATLTEFFKACSGAADPTLVELGRGLTERKLYKAIDVTDLDSASIGRFATAANAAVRARKLEPKYAFVDETAADTPYKPYDPDSSRPASQIYVETRDGKSVEISTRSEALMQLRKKYSLLRYYFQERLSDRIKKAAQETLHKEDKG